MDIMNSIPYWIILSIKCWSVSLIPFFLLTSTVTPLPTLITSYWPHWWRKDSHPIVLGMAKYTTPDNGQTWSITIYSSHIVTTQRRRSLPSTQGHRETECTVRVCAGSWLCNTKRVGWFLVPEGGCNWFVYIILLNVKELEKAKQTSCAWFPW